MLTASWKTLGRHSLWGMAVLATANWTQAQPTPLATPQNTAPIVVPALGPAIPSLPSGQPVPTSTEPAKGPSQPNLGAPLSAADELKTRIERLEKQNQELLEALKALQNRPTPVAAPAAAPVAAEATQGGALGVTDVQKLVNDYLSQKDTQAKLDADAAKRDGIKIGSIMNVNAEFRNGAYLFLSTPNKDYTMHIGGWFQYDNIFWTQSDQLRTPQGARSGPAQGVASGAAQGGINDLQDGMYWRRIRPLMEGTFFEDGEYRFNLALENNQFSSTGIDEFWMGWNNIPYIGTIRAGHVKTPMGMEADMTASSRAMTFMERSSYSESIEQNQNFVTGLWLHNGVFDDRFCWTAAVFRTDNGASTGIAFGDGQFGAHGRLTSLPIYEANGRHLLHLGWSGGWRNGTNNLANSPIRTFTLQARPELRDDDPAANPGGAQPVPNANDARMISTGAIAASNMFITGFELLYIRGPFSFQAEYGWNHIDNAIGIAPNGLNFNPAFATPQNYTFSGGYVQVAYTLTGENRAYDKRRGTIDRYYYGRNGLFNNAWWVRGEDGRLNFNTGAWEIAARCSYTNLNDGIGATRIQGGVMDGVSLALNWYLNTNLSVNFDLVHNNRYDLPTGVIPGVTNGFGMRVQMSF